MICPYEGISIFAEAVLMKINNSISAMTNLSDLENECSFFDCSFVSLGSVLTSSCVLIMLLFTNKTNKCFFGRGAFPQKEIKNDGKKNTSFIF